MLRQKLAVDTFWYWDILLFYTSSITDQGVVVILSKNTLPVVSVLQTLTGKDDYLIKLRCKGSRQTLTKKLQKLMII